MFAGFAVDSWYKCVRMGTYQRESNMSGTHNMTATNSHIGTYHRMEQYQTNGTYQGSDPVNRIYQYFKQRSENQALANCADEDYNQVCVLLSIKTRILFDITNKIKYLFPG